MAKFLVKAAVSALLIWILVTRIDVEGVVAQVLGIGLWPFPAAVAALLALGLLNTLRWKAVLGSLSSRLDFPAAWRMVVIGTFFNQALPSSIGGDAVRIWEARRGGLPLGVAVNSVLLDRVVALLAICVIVAAMGPVLFATVAEQTARWGALGLAVAGLAGIAMLCAFDRLPGALFRWRATRAVAALSVDGRRVFMAPGRLVAALAPAIATQLGLAAVVYLFARALALPVDLLDCLIITPPVMLVTAIPISIAGWGVREGAMVAGFGFLGVGATGALALSVLFGLAAIVAGLPGGVLWLLGRRGAEKPLHPPGPDVGTARR